MPTRDELRQRLRDKIRGKRAEEDTSLRAALRKDPQTALLSMGIDDLDVIRNADAIVTDPHAFLKSVAADDEEGLPPDAV